MSASPPPKNTEKNTPDSPAPKQTILGKTVLVTRSAGQSAAFRDCLQACGALVVELPALEIGPPSSWEPLDRALERLEKFRWLILTSANGVSAFCDRLAYQGKSWPDFPNLQVAVVGKKTAAALKKQGRSPDFVPPDFVADALVEHFPETVSGREILFPRVETGGREVLVRELQGRGAIVTEVPAYESRCPDTLPTEARSLLETGAIDVVTFTSSKIVRNFAKLAARVAGFDLAAKEGIAIASIGPQTSATCREIFGRVDIEATEYSLDGLLEAIVVYFAEA